MIWPEPELEPFYYYFFQELEWEPESTLKNWIGAGAGVGASIN